VDHLLGDHDRGVRRHELDAPPAALGHPADVVAGQPDAGTAGHRPAYSSGEHDGKGQLRAILDGFGERFGKYVLNLSAHSHNYERTKPQAHVVHVTAGIGGGPLATAPTACKWADCKAPPWVAFRAIHHGFVKLTVRAEGITLEAVCAGASPAEDSLRCSDGEVMDHALIAAGG